jgi:2-hydroxychromene-2-carboxylate isomerase
MPGEPPLPAEPYPLRERSEPPTPVDDDLDLFGVEPTVARLDERIAAVRPTAVRLADDGSALLSPPFAPDHDRIEGPPWAGVSLVVFGAHGTPAARSLGKVLDSVRERYRTTVRVAWRHHPDPGAHPRAGVFALAAEAAVPHGRFWVLTREMLRMRHDDPADLHAAMLRAGLDPEPTLAAMRAGTGEQRIVDDVASALASGVMFSPALFINDERYAGELDRVAVWAALDAARPDV